MNVLKGVITCACFFFRHSYLTVLLSTITFALQIEDLRDLHPFNFNDIRCHLDTREDFGLPLAKDNDKYPEKSIFFLDTRCRGGIDSRQSCAIEAAARANPEWQINVLVAGPVSKAFIKDNTLLDLTDFHNVKVRRIHVNKFVKGTPVEKHFHFKTGALWLSPWPVDHATDMLKMLTLYKYGGVYLDLDVYAEKSFSQLPKNFVGSELGRYVGTAVVAASKHGIGRNFTKAVMRELEIDFQPYLFQYNGAELIKRVLDKICSSSKVSEMSAKTCNGFAVLKDKYIYPIDYFHWWVYFEPWEFNHAEAYTHRLWYMLSYNETISPDSLFAQIAKKRCPTVYEMYGNKFGTMRFVNV